VVVGRGSSRMKLSSESRIVLRKSNYVAGDTVMVGADKAAGDLDRRLAEALRNPLARLQFVLVALDPSCRSTA